MTLPISGGRAPNSPQFCYHERMRKQKLFIRTFGCQMNEYDSARMTDALASQTSPAASAEEADIMLFNTCSVRERAQEKVFSDLGRTLALKKDNPGMLVGVGGCVASQEGEAILRRAPQVDLVFGPQTIHRLPQMIEARRRTGKAQVDVSFPEMEKFDALPMPGARGPKAFVSVMEGCSKYCSFCVVPYTRGEEASRPLESVLEETAALAMQGAREITLLGQNVNAYRGRAPDGSEADFASLLECVAAVEDVRRIRFVTSHPVEFTDRLIGAFARIPKLADCVHLPVQSGSDRVLAAMKRGYTALEYKSVIRKLRKARPGIAISTDFIVGFPGETEEDFAKTMALAEEIGFDFSFSFLYSARPGTPAAAMPDNEPPEKKKSRLRRLQETLDASGQEISRGMIGGVENILVEGPSKRHAGEMQGRTSNNRVAHFEAGEEWAGRFARVRITEAMPHALRGELAAA